MSTFTVQSRVSPAMLHAQRGFSFFEVLVAALILAIGVLGFVGLQVRAMDTTGTAHFRAQAAVLAAELAERIRLVEAGANSVPAADPGRANNGLLYVAVDWAGLLVPGGEPATWAAPGETCLYTNVLAGGCTALQQINADALEMAFFADQVLPQGLIRAERCEAGSTRICVYVGWLGQDPDDCAIGDGNPNCVGVEVLP